MNILNITQDIQSEGQSTFNKIQLLKHQPIFGVGSWIFNRHLEKKEDSNKTYLNEIFHVWKLDIINLTELFINAQKKISTWGWDDWEMESKEEGKAHFLNILKK